MSVLDKIVEPLRKKDISLIETTLQGIFIEDKKRMMLSQTSKIHYSLKKINLQDNNIDDKKIKSIVERIKINKMEIFYAMNKPYKRDDSCCAAIRDALKYNSINKEFKLKDNLIQQINWSPKYHCICLELNEKFSQSVVDMFIIFESLKKHSM